MNPFNDCPRCKKKYLLTQMDCDKCNFGVLGDLYRFETEKFLVQVCEKTNQTFIRSKKAKSIPMYQPPMSFYIGKTFHSVTASTFDFTVPEIEFTINKLFSPEATEEDIEKYIILK